MNTRAAFLLVLLVSFALSMRLASTEERPALPRAFIDGAGPDWKELGEADFENVNLKPDTWTWKDGVARCTGEPVGVIRSREPLENFELVAEWRHLRPAGNSGIFVWTTKESLDALKPNQLPKGIECQVLDNGYAERYEKDTGKKAEWFTTHGDVFAVGVRMKPFPPLSPDGSRSFPRQRLSRGSPEWNHYYIRAVNGEVRLWVNGEEVSGGNGCEPRTGYLCLESEGSPVEFRNIRIRKLP
jgi:hypothetical protein